MSVNIKVLKKMHRNHTEETDVKLRVCMYQKGYPGSALKYKSQRAGGNDVGMPLM